MSVEYLVKGKSLEELADRLEKIAKELREGKHPKAGAHIDSEGLMTVWLTSEVRDHWGRSD